MSRWVIGLLALVCAFRPASATIVEHLDLGALVDRADRVVRGHVLRRETHWDSGHRRIYTDIEVAIDGSYKGSGSETVLVRRLGGVIDGIGMTTIGEPEFGASEEVFLFLRRVPSQREEVFVPIGMAQGKLHIRRDANQAARVRFEPQGATLMTRDSSGRIQYVHAEPTERPLADLESEVRALLQRTP